MRFRETTYGKGKSPDARVLRDSNIVNFFESMCQEYKIAGDAAFRSFDSIVVPGQGDFSHRGMELKAQRIFG